MNHFILKLEGDVTQQADKVALTLLSRFDGVSTVVKCFSAEKGKDESPVRYLYEQIGEIEELIYVQR